MFELADGVRVADDDAGPVYSRPPDRAAIEYLLNRVLGRPGMQGDEGQSVSVENSVTIVLPDNGRAVAVSQGGDGGDTAAARAPDAVSFDSR